MRNKGTRKERKEGIIIEFSTITVTMPTEEADKFLESLSENNVFVNQIFNAFLRWVIRDTVAIRSEDVTMLVCMAVDYYEQITGDMV